MFAQKKDKGEQSPDQQIKSTITTCEKSFQTARTKNDFSRLQTQLEQLYGFIMAHKVLQYEDTVLLLLRNVKVNLNFMNRYEDLRNRFLEGETESIYTELIKANREALTPENGVLVPEIISRIQHFLERIAILVNPPSIEQEYGEPESNPANQVTRFDRIILDPGNSQSHIKKDDEINNIPKKRPEKKSIEKNETTIYWPSHHSET